MTTSGIYILTNKINGKQYVGQSWDIAERWSRHPRDRFSKPGYLQNAIKKYGWENFVQKILVVVDNQEDLDRYEIACIKAYDTLAPNGYNLREGGNGGHLHEGTKEKLRAANLGKKYSEETKAKLRGRIPWNKGKTPRPESIAKGIVTKASNPGITNNKGRKLPSRSDETRAKLSASLRGVKHKTSRSPEERNAISLRMRGKRQTSKLTIEQVIEIRKLNPETVKQYKQVGEKYGVHHTTIQSICLGVTWKNVGNIDDIPNKDNPRKRGKRSPESIAKTSAKLRGKKRTGKALENIRNAKKTPPREGWQKNFKMTPETIKEREPNRLAGWRKWKESDRYADYCKNQSINAKKGWMKRRRNLEQ